MQIPRPDRLRHEDSWLHDTASQGPRSAAIGFGGETFLSKGTLRLFVLSLNATVTTVTATPKQWGRRTSCKGTIATVRAWPPLLTESLSSLERIGARCP